MDWNNSHNKLTQDENDENNENKYTGEEKQLLYMLLYEAIAHTGVGFFKNILNFENPSHWWEGFFIIRKK